MKYRLLRDCPHGDAKSEWERITEPDGSAWIGMKERGSGETIPFPKFNFSSWFEEIKEMQKFTKEQKTTILQKQAAMNGADFYRWLGENTEV